MKASARLDGVSTLSCAHQTAASTRSIAYNSLKPGLAAQEDASLPQGFPTGGGSVLFNSIQSVSSLLADSPLQLALLLAGGQPNGLKHYLKAQFADQTFRGLYHWNWFDLALLLPYFTVMFVLALYGVHR